VILDGEGRVVDHVVVTKLPTRGDPRRDGYLVKANAAHLADLLTWLRALADGYVKFEPLDVTAKIEGPVIIEQLDPTCEFANEWTGKMPAPAAPADVDLARPYFIGQSALSKAAAPPAKTPFVWQEPETPVKRTTLYDQHVKLGAKIVPFAGHEMPVRYGSTIEEHQAVRTAAGLFDVSHMGVFDASGPYAEGFVELVSGNYIGGMQVGDSIYDHLFDHAANLLDDLLVYRFEAERYLLVVNAANEAKDWAWLTAVNEGRALLDPEVPHRAVNRPAVLRNLKDPRWGDERRVDLALQGQKSRDILLKIADDVTQAMLRKLGRTKCAYGKLAGLEVAISRTGYTGEPISFELFVHPDRAPVLWNAILDAGRDLGVKPIGLGARDSLRLEAGLPLYGHELEGPFGIMPCDAGFGAYVKLHKPFFVGKNAYRRRTAKRERIIVRFIVPAKGSRPLKTGDPIIDDKGACFGHVTSCATDGQGLLIGQAFVQTGRHKPGPILIVPSGGKKAADELRVGDRVTMPVQAEIIKRWPSR
jgi:glycine hydroxymethyltransferase